MRINRSGTAGVARLLALASGAKGGTRDNHPGRVESCGSTTNGSPRFRAPRRVPNLLVVVVLLAAHTALFANRTADAANPEFEIKLATLAPDNSSLMQIFNEMNAELLRESGGRVGFKMFSGFVLGDEEDVLRKLRIGMIHAAAFTSTALTDLSPGLRVLQVPFLFKDYAEVDQVYQTIGGDIEQGFAKSGFEVLGRTELGFIYFLSKDPITGLSDLKGKKVWAKANAPMSDAIIRHAKVSTVAINAPDVLMALQTNLLEVVYNSPYYTLVTQWNTQVKYLTDLPLSYIGGTLILDTKVFNRLPKDLQATLKRVCAKHMGRLTERTRKDNAEALEAILKRGVKAVHPSAIQVQEFEAVSNAAIADYAAKFIPPGTLEKARAALAEYRKTRPKPQ